MKLGNSRTGGTSSNLERNLSLRKFVAPPPLGPPPTFSQVSMNSMYEPMLTLVLQVAHSRVDTDLHLAIAKRGKLRKKKA